MSLDYLILAWKADLPRPQKIVLLAIADHVNDDGKGCWASFDRLGYKSGYERRQVIRIVDQLEARGILVFEKHHPKWGTNIWNIKSENIPMLPPIEVWIKEQRKKEFEKEEQNVTQEVKNEVGQNVTPACMTFQNGDGQNVTPETSQMSPNPYFLHPSKENPLHTAVPAKAQAPVSSNGVHHDEDDEWSRRIPANERENIDDQITRGDDDLDDKAKMRPKTELEKKITQLCNSSYITDNQRRRLSENVFAAQGKQRPQNYPSPEAEWKENPDRFNAYVEDCARIQRTNTSRPPGRDALIGLIRNYARHKTGWLDFKDYKEIEAAPAKQAEGQYYANRPKRLVFGEKPRL